VNRDDDLQVAERSVVGACLADAGAIRVAVAAVSPADFADARLGQLYGLVLEYEAAGKATDPLTIGTESARRKATTPGGVVWHDRGEVFDVARWSWAGASIGGHADLVASAAHARRVAYELRRGLADVETTDDPTQALASTMTALAALRDGVKRDGITARPLNEVLSDEDTFDWVIPGLLERGDRVVVTGHEGGGKSTLMRQIAICAAAGVHPLTHQHIDPIDVLVVDVENSERQWRRQSRGIAHAANLAGTRRAGEGVALACTARMDITSDRDLSAVHALLEEHHPQILVIGSLYRLSPRGINSDDDAAPVISALDSLRDQGVALMVEAHAGHGKDSNGDRALRPRGSSQLMGWPEFGFGLAPDAEDPNYTHLIRWRGDREERDWPTTLRRGGRFPWETTGPLPSQQRGGWDG